MFRPALLLLTSVAIAYGGNAALEAEAKPLSREQLAVLLGNVDSSLMAWSKVTGADSFIYIGHAKSPLSGIVYIYLGGYPAFAPDPSLPKVDRQLGMYPAKWQKRVLPDGSMQFAMVTSLHSDYWKAFVVVEAKGQLDFDRLIEEIGKYPLFNKMPQPVGAP